MQKTNARLNSTGPNTVQMALKRATVAIFRISRYWQKTLLCCLKLKAELTSGINRASRSGVLWRVLAILMGYVTCEIRYMKGMASR